MPPRLTDEQRAFRAISEKDHQAEVCRIAEMFGWRWRHIHDSRREVVRRGGKKLMIGDKDAAGLPDLVLLRPPEMIFIECKSEVGALSDSQKEWLPLLEACGIEVYVSRPSTIHEVAARLRRSRPRAS